jgi:prephenate dehydrogenase
MDSAIKQKDRKSIGIIGYGQFGKFVDEVFEQEFDTLVYSRTNGVDNVKFFPIEEVCKADFVIPCVPIAKFRETLELIKPYLQPETVVVDVCSIKVYPKKCLKEVLPNQKAVCTHPMFGPESFKHNGNSLKGFNLMVENLNLSSDEYSQLVSFLKQKLELNVVEMTSDEHDRLACEFHFTTLFVALGLKDLHLKRTSIDTSSARHMHDFIERVGQDKGIMRDMYRYNPYCAQQLTKIEQSFAGIAEFVRANYD